jgi:hypothetical protein
MSDFLNEGMSESWADGWFVFNEMEKDKIRQGKQHSKAKYVIFVESI